MRALRALRVEAGVAEGGRGKMREWTPAPLSYQPESSSGDFSGFVSRSPDFRLNFHVLEELSGF